MPRRSFRLVALALFALALAPACASFKAMDIMNEEGHFDETWKSYVRAMRWKNFGAAAQFVVEDERAPFLEQVTVLQSIRMTDHEYGQPDFDDERMAVDVTVTYRGYNEATLIETEFVEKQHWTRNGDTNEWTISPDLSGFKGIASAALPEPARP